MNRKNPLHTLSVADSPYGEHFIQSAAPAANDDAGKNLDALFVAFHHFSMHPHTVAHGEFGSLFAKLFRFNLVK